MEEEAQTHDEQERPLKRLRLRSQGGHVSPLVNGYNHSLGESSLKRPKVEEDEISKTCFEQQPQEMIETPQSIMRTISPEHSILNKGKQPLLLESASQAKRLMSETVSHVVRIDEPTVEAGVVLLPNQKIPDTHVLIKPKDEPFTDDMSARDIPQYELPIAVIRPGAPLFLWINISRLT